jgi:hypothetical protein
MHWSFENEAALMTNVASGMSLATESAFARAGAAIASADGALA